MPGGRHGSGGGCGVHCARAWIHPHVKHTRSSSGALQVKQDTAHTPLNTQKQHLRRTKSARSVTRDSLKIKPRYTSNTHRRYERTGGRRARRGDPLPTLSRILRRPLAYRCLPYIFSPLEFFVDYLHV